ncbi:type II toxin-antitoxin system VapB family antitoxin [Bosea rubneri]|uniref:Type II toxin-antitoxin system VapB family antitoxin n=1 Tax=Bosea rubneri TaxID=3075434 RepID=A0ABU3S9X8_9HYPH|nr:type II toxin-antitoxin system VapB family antitoxin [Bosea sp. ZW T0_25]MDU0341511.1 type II toxin-antitoxin system VapB family antitoxin [Bosea sp. ZW T0_25]
MRTTVTLDDELVERAQAYTGITERSMLLREALTALIQREAARRAIKLGGSDPDASAAQRRRLPAA